MKFRYVYVGIAFVFAITLVVLSQHQRVGVVVVSSENHSEGYLIVAPYRVDVSPHNTQKGVVYLVNKNGDVLHVWYTEAPVLVAHLANDGSLYVTMTPALTASEHPNAGTTGIIQKLSWNGEVLFEHRDSRMMIDFEVLPNGHITYMRWDKTPLWYEIAARGTTQPQGLWANELVEIDEQGKEVWSWRLFEHVSSLVSQSTYVSHDDFSHTNSVRYIEDNTITHTPAYLISARHLSTIYLIERDSGKVLWESKKGLLAYQHDATLLPNGNMLAFDNGFSREGVSLLVSRAVEFSTSTQEVVWQYDGGNTPTGKAQFATSIMGGAQRLSNGNTLITLSVPNRVVEVTPEGEVVWEYLYTQRDGDQTSRMLFNVREYSGEGTGWKRYIILTDFILKHTPFF